MRADPGRAILDRDVPVLLLRTNRNIFHHGTLGAIRSLGRGGVAVHAVLEGPASPAARSRHLRRRLPWGPDPGDAAGLLGHLEAAARRVGRPAVLLAMDDAGALFVAAHARRLARHFLFPEQRPELIESLADKSTLAEICRRRGIAHPWTRLPRSTGEVDLAVRDLGLPLVAKWARPWQLPPGRRPTELVGDGAAARRLFDAAGPGTGPLLLQRRVAPADGADWFFHGYFDASSSCLMGCTGRKAMSAPPRAGSTVLARWTADQEVMGLARGLLSSLGYTGVVDMDVRRDDRTGACHLLDINPRPGAQFRLFADRHGLDLVRAVHLDLSGRAVPPIAPRYGRTFLVENQFARPSVRGTVPLRAATRADETAWYAADDPAPFLAAGALSAYAAVRKLVSR